VLLSRRALPSRRRAQHLLIEEMSVSGGVANVAAHVPVLGVAAASAEAALPHRLRLGSALARGVAPVQRNTVNWNYTKQYIK
jgi:hypothetical protein